MRSLFFLLLGLFFLGSSVNSQNFTPPCADADIVFLGDWSGSIEGFESSLEDGLKTLISILPPKDSVIRYGVVSFSSLAWVDATLTSDSAQLQSVLDIWGSRVAFGGTNILDGLNVANYVFEHSPRDTKKIIVLVTDGDVDSDSEKRVIALASKIRESGITILTIDVGNSFTDVKLIEGISDVYFHSDILLLSETLRQFFNCM